MRTRSNEQRQLPIRTTGKGNEEECKGERQYKSEKERKRELFDNYALYTFVGHGTPSWLTIVVGVFSLLLLLLPLDGESSSWPPWLHVTVTMKLIASFILGRERQCTRYLHRQAYNITHLKAQFTTQKFSIWQAMRVASTNCQQA